jgi:hypothetical protein
VKDNYSRSAIVSFLVLLASGCGGGRLTSTPPPAPSCVPSSKPEFSYVLTGYAVSMFTVNSCTDQFTADTPASISTGYVFPQSDSEEMVVDPLGRFAYVANLVSNASDLSTVSITTVRLKVEENQLVDVFSEIGTRIEGLKGA